MTCLISLNSWSSVTILIVKAVTAGSLTMSRWVFGKLGNCIRSTFGYWDMKTASRLLIFLFLWQRKSWRTTGYSSYVLLTRLPLSVLLACMYCMYVTYVYMRVFEYVFICLCKRHCLEACSKRGRVRVRPMNSSDYHIQQPVFRSYLHVLRAS